MTKKDQKTPVEIIKESGHTLHTEVVGLLKARNYKVEISPYYVDGHTDKPREVDIIATKRIKSEGYSNVECDLIFAIDCKYLDEHTVFWMFENEKPHHALKIGSNPESVISYVGELAFTYFQVTKVARLFKNGAKSHGDVSGDPIFKACSQAIHGTIFARQQSRQRNLIFPIVILDGPGKIFFSDNLQEEKRSALVHIDYSFYPDRTAENATREPFYVWFVKKDHLNEICDIGEKESKSLHLYLSSQVRVPRVNGGNRSR